MLEGRWDLSLTSPDTMVARVLRTVMTFFCISWRSAVSSEADRRQDQSPAEFTANWPAIQAIPI